MKNVKKMLSLLAAAVMTLSLLAGCGTTDPGYQVKVVDALGNPYTEGVVVQFLQNGAAVGMQVVNAEGVAAKELEDGDYTVELTFTDDKAEYYYDKSNLTMSADKKELTVQLAKMVGEKSQLTIKDAPVDAYKVETGCTYVTLKKDTRNYFLFTPTMAGTYEFSLPGSNATVGYYGAPHFVQANHAGSELVDGKFTISVKASMISTDNTGTTVMVLGVDAGENESATLAITRIGEPAWDVSDEPWTVYKSTVALSQYTLPANSTLKEFDLKASGYTLVKDDKGWYHLDSATGPLVVMLLGEKSAYLDDFKTIVEKSRVGKHFYDENGKFIRKESYNECLLEYIAVMDENAGVYPLTDDLKYIIQQRGDYYGWFDEEGTQYLFRDQNGEYLKGINKEISWLFPCRYIG